jgi:hypothetical protein
VLKNGLRRMPFKGKVVFFHSMIVKLGFLDGRAGRDFARSRAGYYERRF